jgi:isoamylase
MDFPDHLLPSQLLRRGAHWDGRGTHFAVFSEHASDIDLCLFDHSGKHEIARLPMPDCTNGVWHGYLPNARPGQLYGYRVYGPYDPKNGHRFNPYKLLLDPYARQLAGELKWHDALYGYRVGSPRADLSFDRRDSAAYMPKAVITDDYFDWENDHPPMVPWSDTVIYEMHLKGFTKQHPHIPETERGTFGALGHPRTIEYLRSLGITAVELLPIHTFVRDRYLREKNLSNYWGYNTLAYFAPEPAYLSDGTLGQIKWAVKQLHAAGIEVILDVVYNHTCEGNELGMTASLRGFDNLVYYRLFDDDLRYYINDTGCGNTVNLTHPETIRLVMDSLRYWVQEFHVDGFRFDLCVTLGREDWGFDPGCGFFDALLQDPVLSRVKLISEPWDIGPGGYQIGNHPAGFAEWNGRYRDDIRRYWRGAENVRGGLAARLQGSADMFDHQHRKPWASVNFVTAHDGFTLADLVSYNEKHNHDNGEDNQDGSNDNDSCNWGHEGPTDDENILQQRAKTQRNFLATLLFSHGTPMLLAGDEFGQTQNGNNNPYCQDNEISWLDWSLLQTEQGKKLKDFFVNLISLRKNYPLLRCNVFQHGQEIAPDVRNTLWVDESGEELEEDDWNNPNARLLGLRRARLCGDRQQSAEQQAIDILLLLCNADCAVHVFTLPQPELDYRLLVDTAFDDGKNPAQESVTTHYEVQAFSLVLLTASASLAQFPGIHLQNKRSGSDQSLTDETFDGASEEDGEKRFYTEEVNKNNEADHE